MKKFLAIITSLVMVMMIFTGCSSNELAYYQNVKSLAALQNYSFSGTTAVKIPTLKPNPSATSILLAKKDSDTDTDPASAIVTQLQAVLNNSTITYNGTVDSKNHKLSLNLIVKMANTLTMPISFILDNSNNKSLLDVSATVASLVIPSTYKYTAVKVNNTAYYQYDLKAIIAQLSAAKTGTDTTTTLENSAIAAVLKGLTTVTNTTAIQNSIQTKALLLGDNLMNKSFKGLTLGLVAKKGNTYSLHVTAANAVKALQSTLTYIGKNSAAFIPVITSFVGSLSDSEVASFGINGITTKAQLAAAISSIKLTSLTAAVPALMNELNTLVKNITLNIDSSITKTVYKTLTKDGAGRYDTTSSVTFDDTKCTSAPYFVSFSIKTTQKITY